MNQEIYEELLFARTLITDTKDFESRFEDILTMVIPPWIINPYGDIEETNVIIQEELTELSTNEELKVQFKNGYQQFWLQNNIPVTYPPLRIVKQDDSKRKRRTQKSEILTSTPIREQLRNQKNKKLSKTKLPDEMKRAKKPSSSNLDRPKLQYPKPPVHKTDPNEENVPCLVCGDTFGNSRPGETWIECNMCQNWAHQLCADYNRAGLHDRPNYEFSGNDTETDLPVFNIEKLTEDGIITAIRKLKNKMTPDPDNIPSFLIKDCSPVLANPLAKSFQSCGNMPELNFFLFGILRRIVQTERENKDIKSSLLDPAMREVWAQTIHTQFFCIFDFNSFCLILCFQFIVYDF
ncbi:unnamed protein product [Acanthoscelides obtectus]|uniref:Zinc finger PHD-type domain-containing protein n=1 Tax=Acanthoscelides obtectus TaxID=200917 RepID=A0A9P0Q6Q8_ACAOB|nr:unnamed protein product [Acanthoscelides obtectus]CAK1651327.1 hypothetical protein AOBTE_LOCUS17188 [Acanthoscelides obtectus]